MTVRVRFPQLRSVTRSITLPLPISSTLTLTEVALQLAASALSDSPNGQAVTLLAVSASNLAPDRNLQLELPLRLRDEAFRPGAAKGALRWAVDRSVDAVRGKFGRSSIGYATVVFSGESRVPEQFRELAERTSDRE